MEIRRSISSSKLGSHHQDNPYHRYQIGSMLGQGQFGKVFKAHLKNPYHNHCAFQNKSTITKNKSIYQFRTPQKAETLRNFNQTYAIKIIPLSKLKKNPKLKQLLANQVHILGNLQHKHIIKFQQIFVWEDKVYMVYEYCEGGNFEDMIPLPPDDAVDIFHKIIKACSFAERNNILHRDIKPANILFQNGEPKVADWGFSRYLEHQFMANSFLGSPAYMAPELLRGSQYTNKADVWSFGVMVYEAIFDKMPWQAQNMKQLLEQVESAPLKIPTLTNPVLKFILKSCLQTNPVSRASFQKLQKYMDLSQKTIKTIKTEKNQNPQKCDNEQQKQQHIEALLSQSDIRKCSKYLSFAKMVQKFQDHQSKVLCLQFIINSLESIKQKYNINKKNITNITSSQKRISDDTKYSHRSPTKKSKDVQNQSFFEVFELLNKEITLIKKIQSAVVGRNISYTTRIQSKKLLTKQLLKKLLKNINNSQKLILIKSNEIQSSKVQSSNSPPTRRQLLQMNNVLQILMYNGQKQKQQTIKNKESLSLLQLMRIVNCRILYINHKICKREQ